MSPSTPQTHSLRAPDNHSISLMLWPAANDGPFRGLLHICHGMAEHAGRYGPLAAYLNSRGWTVAAHHHRGHGQQRLDPMPGHYADEQGWDRVVNDVHQIQQWLATEYPEATRVLMGHSMGSFIAQGYLARYRAEGVAGAILSGSNYDSRLRLRALQLITAVERWRHGRHGKSPLIHTLSFGAFARQLTDGRTEYDWLSRDRAAVDAYIADPACGFDCTTGLWNDLVSGLLEIQSTRALKKIPGKLPLLILAGSDDPVGHFGAGPRRLADAYRKTGHADLSLRLYPGMRHEPLNETGREQVFEDIGDWLERYAPGTRESLAKPAMGAEN